MFISDHLRKSAGEIKEENLKRISNCGICGGMELKIISVFKEKPNINIIQCSSCHAVTYDKVLGEESIDELYSDESQYYDDSNENDQGVTFYGSERFAKHLYSLIKSRTDLTGNLSILDFGGGSGALAYAVGEYISKIHGNSSIHITVCDYTDSLIESKADNIELAHQFPLQEIEQEFDIIIASGVMEHIPDSGEYYRLLFAKMKENGCIYFRTPYIYPLYRAFKKIGIEYDTLYPGHIWDLGGKWWDDLPQKVSYPEKDIVMIASRPSVVEKSFSSHFFVALASYIMKAPWFVCHRWSYVGGWEAVYQKNSNRNPIN